MEEYTPQQQDSKSEEVKRWLQDNLRVIISVIIVVLIAGGIYSYSKRGESPIVSSTSTENVDKQQTETNVSGGTQTSNAGTVTSKETETSFVETAVKGDGLTVLARRATADYLEKNSDSSLTKEHKIYIEDYLRKNVGQKGGIRVGSSVEFSKDLIQKAVSQSKNLSEKQLKNLQKYSARVSSL